MGRLLRRMWRILDTRAAQRFDAVEERFGRRGAIGAMLLSGAYLGVMAVWISYGLVVIGMWLQIHKRDDLLVMLFLCAWLLIGAVQGAWLGSALGYALAMRCLKRERAAHRTCFANGLLFLTVTLILLFRVIPVGDRFFALSLLSALPTLTAVLMLIGSMGI